MNRLHMFRFLAAVIVAALLAVPTLGVQAKDVIRYSYDYSDDFGTGKFCGPSGPTLTGSSTGHLDGTLFGDPRAGLDATGHPMLTKANSHQTGRGTVTNLDNGKMLTISEVYGAGEDVVSYFGGVDVPVDGTTVPGASYRLARSEHGVTGQVKTSQGRVVSIDAGLFTNWTRDVVIYYLDGEPIVQWTGVDQSEGVLHGPHPLYDPAHFCQLVDEYLT